MSRKSDLTRRIQIFIDGSQAQKGVEELEDEIAGLTAELEKLDHADKDFEKRSKDLKATLDAKNQTLENYRKKVSETKRVLENLSGATYEELLAVHRKLQEELRKTVPGTEQYTRVLEQNMRVSKLMAKVQKDMRTEVGCQATAFGRAAAFVNKYAMLLSGALAATTGLTMTVRKVVDDFAKMEEAMADVKKYTGMADEGVKALNEDLKNMDTRTSRERLNALAADAGRLGIQSRDAILEFVDAADKINVALGEDLGEDAVKNIGKLAQMFGESDRLGLRGAMLATGSAVNELAQNSSASEPYIVEFTARLAGVSKQANISQANIMGYASALDQNMQQMETSATVMSQLITKMFQQPARFAELAGMQVKEFSELISKDANAALLRLLGTMQAKGGFDTLAPMFEEMKLNGTRAIGVLSAVASHIDQVKEAQALANKAYNEGNSVINEFNVKNNTVQARLEKAKKGFLEVSIALGEQLQPASAHLITTGSALIKVLHKLITVTHDHLNTIAMCSAAYGIYTAAVNSAVLASKLKVFWNTKVIASLRTLYTVLRNNPWGIVAMGVAALAGYLMDLRRRADEVTESQRAMERVGKKTADEYDEQTLKLRMLTSAVRTNTNRIEDRRKAIEEIKRIVPDYNASIDEEGRLINENTSALEAYMKNLEKSIKMKAAQEELEEQYRNKRKLERQLQGENEALREAKNNLDAAKLNAKANAMRASTPGANTLMTGLDQGVKSMETEFSKASKAVEKTNESLKETSDAIALLEDEIRTSGISTVFSEEASGETPLSGTPDPSDGSEADKARKSRLEALKTEYTQTQAEIKRLYAQGNDDMLQTEQQFNARMLELKKDYLRKVIEAAGAGTKEAADAENEMAEIQLQERKDAVQRSIDLEKSLYEQEKKELQEDYISRNDAGIDSQEAYNEQLEQLELRHLQRMLEITGLDADSRMQIEQQVRDFKVKCLNEMLKAQEDANKKKVENEKKAKDEVLKVAETQRQTLEGYAKSFGDTVGKVLSGQEDALKAFADTMIDIVFDVLEKIIEAKIAEATATAVAAQAKATAESFATADSVLTFGASGAARAAVMSALIMGALAAAKATLKGLLGGGSGSSSSTGGETTSSPKVYQRVAQHASGRYQVIGEQDGRRYDVPFIGPTPTGIVRSPALVAENGSELIINTEDLQRLQKHMNYPLVLQAIAESRRPQPVVQHAQGNYPQDTVHFAPSVAGGENVMSRLADVLEDMVRNGVKAPVVLSEIEKKQQLRAAARKIGSKVE